MPKNISEIYSSRTGRTCTKVIDDCDDGVECVKYTEQEEKFLSELALGEETEAEFKELIAPAEEDSDDEDEAKDGKKEQQKKSKSPKKFLITLKDVKWLDQVLKEQRKNEQTEMYLHELLEQCDLILPQNEIIERNPELEARCVKLRQKQEEYLYHKMTRNVDGQFKDNPEDTISFQSKFLLQLICTLMKANNLLLLSFPPTVKMMNRQLIAVAQFIFSVLAGFAFGFIGIELIIGNLDFGFRLLLGIIIALVIALAEIYFLAKRLNEDSTDKDDQMRTMKTPGGGPSPKKLHTPASVQKGAIKPHQE